MKFAKLFRQLRNTANHVLQRIALATANFQGRAWWLMITVEQQTQKGLSHHLSFLICVRIVKGDRETAKAHRGFSVALILHGLLRKWTRQEGWQQDATTIGIISEPE